MVNSAAAGCDDGESTADQYRNIYVLLLYLFMLYWTMLSEAPTTQRLTIGWLTNWTGCAASCVPALQYRWKPLKTTIMTASAEYEPEAWVPTTRTCYSHLLLQTVLHTQQATPAHHQNSNRTDLYNTMFVYPLPHFKANKSVHKAIQENIHRVLQKQLTHVGFHELN